MKRMQRIVMIPSLVAVLLAAPGYGAEPVAPRFPDTELLSPAQEDNVMSRQGVIYVSGKLLVSPCVLSGWANEMQERNWISGPVHQVTLVLEGCGNGAVLSTMARDRDAPIVVSGRWGGGNTYFPLRLNNGRNHLTLPVSSGAGGMRLEMTYE